MEQQNNRDQGLSGKKVIVLGGSSGIGLATAEAAAAAGAAVTIVSGNRARLDHALNSLPPGTEAFAVDLGQEAAIRAFFGERSHFDHLVYTAGENLRLEQVGEMNMDTARSYFNIRYWGALAAIKYGSGLINAGGAITLTSGIAAVRPGSGWSLGASICAAMEGLTRAMAIELAPLRVNIVSPGIVQTPLWDGLSEEARDHLFTASANALPLGRIGAPEYIARAYLYLMQQPFVTGQVLITDGGGVLV